jgi:hypothetical protein
MPFGQHLQRAPALRRPQGPDIEAHPRFGGPGMAWEHAECPSLLGSTRGLGCLWRARGQLGWKRPARRRKCCGSRPRSLVSRECPRDAAPGAFARWRRRERASPPSVPSSPSTPSRASQLAEKEGQTCDREADTFEAEAARFEGEAEAAERRAAGSFVGFASPPTESNLASGRDSSPDPQPLLSSRSPCPRARTRRGSIPRGSTPHRHRRRSASTDASSS